jgi:hypothetical protein
LRLNIQDIVKGVIKMIRVLKISINFISILLLSITILFVTNGNAQNNTFEFYKLNISNEANYWNDIFIGSQYSWEYGIFFPQQKYLYDHFNYFEYEFPDTTFISPWLLTWGETITQSGFPNNTNSITSFINRSPYVQSIYSGLPLGCDPIFEKKTCVSRGACHIPLSCSSYMSNYFYF